MTWRSNGFPRSAHSLLKREPLLCAGLVGWFDGHPLRLVTRDRSERLWLWSWERTVFVDARGEPLMGKGGHGAALAGEMAASWLWVPLFGPWTQARQATASDHMMAIVDLLRRMPTTARTRDAAGGCLQSSPTK